MASASACSRSFFSVENLSSNSAMRVVNSRSRPSRTTSAAVGGLPDEGCAGPGGVGGTGVGGVGSSAIVFRGLNFFECGHQPFAGCNAASEFCGDPESELSVAGVVVVFALRLRRADVVEDFLVFEDFFFSSSASAPANCDR